MAEQTKNTEVDTEIEEVPDLIEDEAAEDYTPPTPKRNWLWMRDSMGQSSATLTIMFWAFLVTTFLFVGTHIESIEWTDTGWIFRTRSLSEIGMLLYFVPTMGLYFGRRWRGLEEAKASKRGEI